MRLSLQKQRQRQDGIHHSFAQFIMSSFQMLFHAWTLSTWKAWWLKSPNVSPLTSLLVTFISLPALSLALEPFYPTSPPHPLAFISANPSAILHLKPCYPSLHLHYLHPPINHRL